LKVSTEVQVESIGVAKMLQSEIKRSRFLEVMDIYSQKNAKIQTKKTRNGCIGSIGK
jgi:hypothetical protein